jgi:glutathione S-transferase
MKLYYSPGACSLASHIALHEIGLPFEAVRVQGRGQKTAGGEDYATVTAKNYVPALRLDDGQVLTEGTAILPYIADRKPESGLARLPVRSNVIACTNGSVTSTAEVHKNFGPFFAPGTTDEQKAAAKANLGKRFDFTQAELGDKPFLLGAHFTVVDAYLFTVLGWCGFVGIDLGQWPGLKAYHARIAGCPAAQAAMKAEGLIK